MAGVTPAPQIEQEQATLTTLPAEGVSKFALSSTARDLIVVEGGIQRDDGATRSDNTEVARDPSRMVVCEKRESRPALESACRDPTSDGLRHAAKLSVGATLDSILVLQFERHVTGPELRAFDKTVIEGRHGSWGIYTKRLLHR